jgi:hypothetical protein
MEVPGEIPTSPPMTLFLAAKVMAAPAWIAELSQTKAVGGAVGLLFWDSRRYSFVAPWAHQSEAPVAQSEYPSVAQLLTGML